MDYSIRQLAALSGVTTRTLRYYDQIGLLRPRRDPANDYRRYGPAEVDLLQQILFFRAMGLSLEEIGTLISDPDFDRGAALERHLDALRRERERLDALIRNVTSTISTLKGETVMNDKEKFEGLKEKLAAENEAAYGAELRERFGDQMVDASNAKLRGMSQADYDRAQSLSGEISEALKKAAASGDPAGPEAEALCRLHREWLCLYWPEGTYSPAAHAQLGESYAADERFKAYYDAVVPGGAAFLRDALNLFCQA